MDVRRLLKVYNVVNDERKHRFNIKFAGVLAAFLLSGVALVGFYMAENRGDPGQTPNAQNSQTGEDARTECVVLTPEEMAQSVDPSALAQQRAQAWHDAHPDASVHDEEEVRRAGVLVGHCFTYVP